MVKKAFTAGLLLAALFTQAQQVQESGWLASFNTIKLGAKTSLHAELQIRSTDNLAALQTILPRAGFNYHVNKMFTVTAGYAYILNRTEQQGIASLLPEHRLWQQLIFMQPGLPRGMSLQHRIRFEERFLPEATVSNGELKKDGTLFTTRFRYFARFILPLQSHGGSFTRGAFAALQEEVFLNTSQQDNVNGQVFDQNRAYLALGYRLSSKMDVEAGYLNQYTQRKQSQPNTANHVMQLALYTRL